MHTYIYVVAHSFYLEIIVVWGLGKWFDIESIKGFGVKGFDLWQKPLNWVVGPGRNENDVDNSNTTN